MIKTPYFSIVTPAFNREYEIARCIKSVLNQTMSDFEMIIVDDFSKDGTVEAIRSFDDKRVNLIKHNENKGVCAARRTGTESAKGKWVVSLDSDWTLDTNALEKLYHIANEVPQDVGVIGGMIRTDKGDIWPGSPPPDAIMDYVEWIKWKEKCTLLGASDFQPARRRQVFEDIKWPAERVLETKVHWQIAKRWKAYVVKDVLATQYLSTNNSISRTRSLNGYKDLIPISDFRSNYEIEVIEEFGEDLLRFAPTIYYSILWNAMYWNFLAGKRKNGIKYAIECYKMRPLELNNYILTLCGMISPKCVVYSNYLRTSLKNKLFSVVLKCI